MNLNNIEESTYEDQDSMKTKMPVNIGCRASLCGEKGIRTLGTRKGTTVFETAPIDHSGISPVGLGCKCIHFIGKNYDHSKFAASVKA